MSAEVPPYESLLWSALQSVITLGGSASITEFEAAVITRENIPPEVQRILHGTGPATEMQYRLEWVRTCLKGMQLLTNRQRGIWSVTESGQTVTEKEIRKLHSEYVASYKATGAGDFRIHHYIRSRQTEGKEWIESEALDDLRQQGIGTSTWTIRRARKIVKMVDAAVDEAMDEAAPMAWSTIPGNQREKLDKAKASIRKELEKELRARLLAEAAEYRTECDANVAAFKAQLDAEAQRARAVRDEERQRYKEGIEVFRAKGLITPAEYSTIRSCLHPDSRKSVTDEKLAAAFRVFNDSRIKTLLVKN